jgi:hypothetical protein
MSAASDPRTDPQSDPEAFDTPARPATMRRWTVPLAFVGGAAAVALVGAVALASSGMAPSTAMAMARSEYPAHAGQAGHADRVADGVMPMQRRSDMDPAMRDERNAERRAGHISELAGLLGVDVDELTATLEGFRADHAATRESMRAELAELDPAERREAMLRMSDERRAALAGVLGVDAAVLAELHEQLGHGPQDGRMRGSTGPRMGSFSRG